MRNVLYILCSLILALSVQGNAYAEAKQTREERKAAKIAQRAKVSSLVDSLLQAKRYVFVPNRAQTKLQYQPYITLSSYYEFRVTPSKITSRLPFYGGMYTAPATPFKSPLDFSSTDFTYNQSGKAEGKERAIVRLELKSALGNQAFSIVLEVFDDATAVMVINSPMASNLTFMGTIEPISDNDREEF